MDKELGTILFLPVEAASHFTPTFKLAKALKKEGCKIMYGSSEKYKDLILTEGFEFIELNIMPVMSLKNERQLRRENIFRFFFSNLVSLGNIRYRRARLMVSDYQKRITAVNPSVIFIDSYHILNAVFLDHLATKIISFNTQIPSNRGTGMPPINSGFIPVPNSALSKFVTELIWRKYFITRFFKRMRQGVITCGMNNFALLKKLSSDKSIPFHKRIAKNRFYYGLNDIEEISFAPQKFDFRHVRVNEKLFNTSMVDLSRQDNADNPNDTFQLIKSKFLEMREQKKSPIIYCCLGTLSSLHSRYASGFFKILINIFTNSNKVLVISTGKSQNLNYVLSMFQRHNNIFVVEHLPQLKMLDHADLMINHGGINSIMECISKEVPMLVYPLSATFDQKGNAARVVHHKLGLRGKIKGDSYKMISYKIDYILDNQHTFKQHLKTFNAGLTYEIDVDRIFKHD